MRDYNLPVMKMHASNATLWTVSDNERLRVVRREIDINADWLQFRHCTLYAPYIYSNHVTWRALYGNNGRWRDISWNESADMTGVQPYLIMEMSGVSGVVAVLREYHSRLIRRFALRGMLRDVLYEVPGMLLDEIYPYEKRGTIFVETTLGGFYLLLAYDARNRRGWLLANGTPEEYLSTLYMGRHDINDLYNHIYWSVRRYSAGYFMSNHICVHNAYINVLFNGRLLQLLEPGYYQVLLTMFSELSGHSLDYVWRHVRDMAVRPVPVCVAPGWTLLVRYADDTDSLQTHVLTSTGHVRMVPGMSFQGVPNPGLFEQYETLGSMCKHGRIDPVEMSDVFGLEPDFWQLASMNRTVDSLNDYMDLSAL